VNLTTLVGLHDLIHLKITDLLEPYYIVNVICITLVILYVIEPVHKRHLLVNLTTLVVLYGIDSLN